ncbi:MAG: transglutaminase N-terminal domain-containing protein [Pseudonocardia sp.]
MTVYRVTHRTEYSYSARVSSSFGEAVMAPRPLPAQECLSTRLDIEPAPHGLRERTDYFGNRTSWFSVLTPHTRLAVTATSVVRVRGQRLPEGPTGPWERAGELARLDTSAVEFLLESPQVAPAPVLADYAAASFPPGRDALSAARDLCSRIHRDLAYTPGVTEVSTTTAEVLERRAGVCQDFAHVAIGCLRAVGLAARYVSGYLETEPPPGRPRLEGADATHAWVSVLLPGGWVDLDPTNDQPADGRYVTTAWGRDYTDVPPLKGVIFSQGRAHDLAVAVDVVRVPDPGE